MKLNVLIFYQCFKVFCCYEFIMDMMINLYWFEFFQLVFFVELDYISEFNSIFVVVFLFICNVCFEVYSLFKGKVFFLSVNL